MQEGLPPEFPTDNPPNDPHWGEAQEVWGIWDELQHMLPPDPPPEDPNQRMALHMSRLWEELIQELSLEQTPMETLNNFWGLIRDLATPEEGPKTGRPLALRTSGTAGQAEADWD
ncbi:hypothetical protein DUI87_35134 [Hirundo rustica rustica]|uniref:Uncharacterized protein n=1 Tax=Hirundo rustica rustica TaxID=333673 RepID=A0A3M0IHB8_HIRRU|nr:hypothetical protein DUI87_35134 [Hirundo rustica rustica]